MELGRMAAELDILTLNQKLDQLHAELEQINSETYSAFLPDWDPPYEFPPGRDDCYLMALEKDRIDSIKPCAEAVLKIFNQENLTDYELMDCLDICFARDYDFFAHCNFTAKPNSAPLKAGDFSSKVFFAELKMNSKNEIIPSNYAVLDGVNWKLGCEMCPEVVAHPTSGPGERFLLCRHSPHFIRVD
ncbi:uncharacterized protein LOC110713432 isoform X1 [Chenopodium quinoa]|uniref:uncharacterized protein LOC110713432 isoform X1 n=2 Tax=Chenopodium quinoa TaxID=63459 RepID=UPI000B76F268|nr:uncharacterized protein LOC110713432 isoform X1 [Chenopodium quinoa]